MANVRIQLDLTVPSFAFRWLLVAALLMVSAGELASESVTLNTYYPAPSGVYTQMITTNNNWMARDSGVTDIGMNQASTNNVLTVHGNATFNHDVTVANNETVSGNETIGGNDTVGGNLQVNGNATVNGVVTAKNKVTGAYGLLPNYAGWAAYGTGDGGAAIYNDAGGYKTLMVVGNNSAGGDRNVGVWDDLTVNGKYVHLPGAYGYCSGLWTSGDVWNTLCGPGKYATYTAGVYVDGWTYQARGNTSMDSSGDSYVLCCSK